MTSPSDAESAQTSMFWQTRRLIRRALARKWLVLSVALLLTAAVVGRELLRTGRAFASMSFRIDELVPEDEADTVPRPTGLFREYIMETVLSHPHRLALIKKFGLYPGLLRRGPRFATDAFLDDLDLVFYRNFFLEEEHPKRSVMLTVRYAARDPAVAYAVVNEIAAMLAAQQRAEARQRAATLMRWSASAVAAARKRHEALQKKYVTTLGRLVAARGSERRVLLQEAAWLVDASSRAADDYERVAETRASAASWERFEQMGRLLSFTLVDFEKPVRQRPTALAVTILAIAVLAALLFLVAIAVGAFTLQVYDREDVQHIGLRFIGQVPPFPGWRAGTLRARRAGDRLTVENLRRILAEISATR